MRPITTARGRPKRILGVLKCGILGATALMVIGVAAFQLIPQVLLGLFNANADMLAVGDPALRTMSLAFVFAGACIIVGGVFRALGNSVYSMIVSIARQRRAASGGLPAVAFRDYRRRLVRLPDRGGRLAGDDGHPVPPPVSEEDPPAQPGCRRQNKRRRRNGPMVILLKQHAPQV